VENFVEYFMFYYAFIGYNMQRILSGW